MPRTASASKHTVGTSLLKRKAPPKVASPPSNDDAALDSMAAAVDEPSVDPSHREKAPNSAGLGVPEAMLDAVRQNFLTPGASQLLRKCEVF